MPISGRSCAAWQRLSWIVWTRGAGRRGRGRRGADGPGTLPAGAGARVRGGRPVNGEQHPLLNLVAEHSVTLLAMLRTMTAAPPHPTNQSRRPPPDTAPDDAPPPAKRPPTQNGRYHHIPIVVGADRSRASAVDAPSEAS